MNLKQYKYFHPSTNGTEGRAVFIDPSLIGRFLDLIDISNAEGRNTAAKLFQLRNSAGNGQAHSSVNKPAMHYNNFGTVQVQYTIIQGGSESDRGPGVYIHDIRSIDTNKKETDTKPGFYLTEKMGGRWELREPVNKMSTKVGVIGAKIKGETYDASYSANEYGSHLHDIGGNYDDQYSFFYSPGYITNALGQWRTPLQKNDASFSQQQQQFANILQATLPWVDASQAHERPWENAPTPQYQWYVFDEGAKFLMEALKVFKQQIAGSSVRTLREHQFHFVNPKRNLGDLLRELESIKAQVTQGAYEFEDQLTAKLHQIMRTQDTVAGLQAYNLPSDKMHKTIGPINDRIRKYQNTMDDNSYFSDLVKTMQQEVQRGWS